MSFIKSFCAYAMLLSYMIPISLYIVIELIRLFQRSTISKDLRMYSKKRGFCRAHNSNLNEELACVDIIFSDKTGTLTENEMRFISFCTGGEVFNIEQSLDEIRTNNATRKLLENVALCNSVIITELGYSSESPDEVALVTKCAELGVTLVSKTVDDRIIVEVDGETKEFQHLVTIEFSSARRKMSVVVRTPENKILVLTKGADSVMNSVLSPGQEHALFTFSQVDSFAIEGLRTLVYASKEISEEEFINGKSAMILLLKIQLKDTRDTPNLAASLNRI